MLPPVIYLSLFVNFNIFWFATYYLVIRRGFKDKTYGIPFVALAVNTTWDVYGAFIRPSPSGQAGIDALYVIIDLIIYWQVLKYWQSDQLSMTRFQFYFFVALSLVMSFTLYRAALFELNDVDGVRLAYIDNLINSAFFVMMVIYRPTPAGQSLYIGLFKMIGTGSAIIATAANPWPGTENSSLLPPVYIFIFLLDLIYVILIYRRIRAAGLNPWKHF